LVVTGTRLFARAAQRRRDRSRRRLMPSRLEIEALGSDLLEVRQFTPERKSPG
jgi:hypothetical protein